MVDNKEILERLQLKYSGRVGDENIQISDFDFSRHDICNFKTFEEAYHQLISDLVNKQLIRTGIIFGGDYQRDIFVDGGFSRNKIFMQFLADYYPNHNVYSATISQASALGSALILHDSWNDLQIPIELVKKKLVKPSTKK